MYPSPCHPITSQTSEPQWTLFVLQQWQKEPTQSRRSAFPAELKELNLSPFPPSFCLWPLDQPWLPMRTHRNTTRLGLSGRKPARPEFCCSKDFFLNFILQLRKEARACASLQECWLLILPCIISFISHFYLPYSKFFPPILSLPFLATDFSCSSKFR